MEKVAIIWGNSYIYWNSIIIFLGAVSAVLMALALRLGTKRRLSALLVAIPLAVVLSLFFARLIHWYCRSESYAGFSAAMTDFSTGGWSLMGVFAGVILACVLVWLMRLTDDLPALLDCVAPAGALGIAVGRLGDLFTTADRGKMIFESEALHRLPFSVSVVSASGAEDWRFATFCIQSIWSAIIFVILILFLLLPRRAPKRKKWESGQVFLLFLSIYCPSQVLLDSTRYDALFFRSNGFVSVEQIVCALVLLGLIALYAARSIQASGFRPSQPVLIIVGILGMGLAGFMEYFVQRHGDEYILAYGLMIVGLLVWFWAAMRLRNGTLRQPGDTAENQTVPQE